MPFEGLLTKLGPTLVREATPHLVQLVGSLTERFRKDTRDIKESVDAEMAAVARTHAGLASAVQDQSSRLEAIQEQLAISDRKVELLHKAVESLTRQIAGNASDAAAAQRSARSMALAAAVLSGLALAAIVAATILHR